MNTKKYDITIIGGGISGLSLAFLLAKMDRNVLVLDKAERAGGAIESLSYDDFSIDMGAHTAYNSYSTFLQLTEQTTVKQNLIKRDKQKYYFASPQGFERLTKPLHLTELALNLPKILSTKKENKSVQEYYANILGGKNYCDFARHFFKAVLCQNADNYPAAFFLKRRDSRNKAYPRSFTFTKGMQAFTDVLQAHPKITVQSNVKVKNIRKSNSFEVATTQATFHSEAVAFACYAEDAAQFTTKLAPSLSSLLAKISYQTVSSLGIIIDKKHAPQLAPFAGLLTTTNAYTSIVSRDIAPHKKYRGFSIHAQGKITAVDLRNMLCKTLNITADCILKEMYKNNYLPQLQKGHEDFLEALVASTQETPGIYVTGNYFHGLSLEDCLQRSKQEALRYISTP